MEKQTKNIITREWVENELRFHNTADIRSSLVVSGALSLLCVPLAALTVYGSLSLPCNVPLKILLCIIAVSVFISPVLVNLFPLLGSFKEKKLLKNGEFDITVREVLHKSEKVVQRHTEEFLHFEGFEEISVGHTQFQLSSPGDEFYIVHYRTKKSIKLLYSAKMYELQASRPPTARDD